MLLYLLPIYALVWHPDKEPDLDDWTDRPPENVIGHWDNGSCVVIAPNYIITAKHVGRELHPPAPLYINGVRYQIDPANVFDHPAANVDLRVVKLTAGNRPAYLRIYKSQVFRKQKIVFAGYGMGRGESIPTGDGYFWDGRCGQLRYGTNRISGVFSNVFLAEFEAPDAPANVNTQYESALATCDSGSGWFIQTADGWQLLAITVSVTSHDVNPEEEYSQFGDTIISLRLAYNEHYDWIMSVDDGKLAESIAMGPIPGDYNGDLQVDIFDLSVFLSFWLYDDCGPGNNDCNGSNLDNDRDVDLADYKLFLDLYPHK